MSRLESRLRKVEGGRTQRLPYVVHDDGDPAALERALAPYRATGQCCVILPTQCSSQEEWARRPSEAHEPSRAPAGARDVWDFVRHRQVGGHIRMP